MALPITGGGPTFPNTICDVVAESDLYLEASFHFEDIDAACVPAIQHFLDTTTITPNLIIEKGHFIFTSEPTQSWSMEDQGAQMIASLNFALVG